MQPRYGLYVLLAVVSILALIFGAARAWGPIGLVPLIMAALAVWMIRTAAYLEGPFEAVLMRSMGIVFATAAGIALALLVMYSL